MKKLTLGEYILTHHAGGCVTPPHEIYLAAKEAARERSRQSRRRRSMAHERAQRRVKGRTITLAAPLISQRRARLATTTAQPRQGRYGRPSRCGARHAFE